MRVAIIGCGFVADLYMETLRRHRDLELVGAWDRDAGRLYAFARHYGAKPYRDLADVLGDEAVDAILNLTNPSSHSAISTAALRARKHVYSEKPLAMDLDEARALVVLAREQGCHLSGAPSRLLGRPAQTMWAALGRGVIGEPYLVYAEMDDGLLHRMGVKRWRGASGAPWPYKDELRVGNTLEHAGYVLTWLAAFFGPVESVTAFGARAIKEKDLEVPIEEQAADVTFAGIQFRSGVACRLTCSIVAPHDHQIRIFGEKGTLSTDDCWKPRSPVRVRPRLTFRGRTTEAPFAWKLPLLGDAEAVSLSKGRQKVDFCLGPTELARAIAAGRPSRLTPELCLHVTEISLAITRALQGPARAEVTSTFDPIVPMPWAS